MNLRTGKKLSPHKWKVLPMPQEVINRVNAMGKSDGQPDLLTFFDRKGNLIGDDTDVSPSTDEDVSPPTDDMPPDKPPDTSTVTPGVEDYNPVDFNTDPEYIDPAPDYIPNDVPADDADYTTEEPVLDPQTLPNLPAVETVNDNDDDDAPAGVRRSSRSTHKPTRLVPAFGTKKYATSATNVGQVIPPDHDEDPQYTLVAHTIMTQLSMKAGLKKWGDEGTAAVSKELSQLHYRDTFEPLHTKSMSQADYDGALESHLFLKNKRDGTIKGRAVAGGNKQRGTIPKEEASSPTAKLESVLLTAIIDAQEHRDVATIDIPNAFVQTRLVNDSDKAIMRLRGKLAELMVKVAPEIYTKYVTVNNKGETVLYVKLLNAL
jgi:hypothetical protein